MVTIWSDDFEDDDISDWRNISGTVEVTASPARDNYAIKAHNTSQAYSPIFHSINETTIEYWQIQNASRSCYIYVISAGDDALGGIRLETGGNIQVFSKGAWNDTGYTYSINTWYNLKIVLKPATNTYDVYRGITKIASDIDTYAFTEVKTIRILGAWGGIAGEYGVWDDFVVTGTPHEASVDLYAVFDGQNEASVDLYAVFDGQTSLNLAAEFRVGQGSEDLFGKLNARHETSVILRGEFEVSQDSEDLLCRFNAGFIPVDLLAHVNITHSVDLLGRIQIRQASIDFLARFEVGQGAEELLGRAAIRHSTFSDLKFSFYVRPLHLTAAEMLIGGRDRQMDLGGLDRKMVVGGRDRRMRIR